MITLVLFIVFIGLVYHFEPALDHTKSGEWLLWYNSDRRTRQRKYKKLW